MRTVILTALFSLLSSCLLSQPDPVSAETAYGKDPSLFNGRKYMYYLPPGTGGDQFINGPAFRPGSVVVNGITFPAEALNYDILNQEVLLQYPDPGGARQVIALSQAWIAEFSIENRTFRITALNDQPRMIFQVVGKDDLQFLIHWEKTLKLDMAYGSESYTFGPPERSIRLLRNGKYLETENNKAFSRAFNPAQQSLVRKHLKQNRIKIKKAADPVLAELLEWCSRSLK
jgi:hypothetical protein